jgi:DNA-binding response OmpR family regulator/HPt (histidine-containing phosphotransfer) domain-containing protein
MSGDENILEKKLAVLRAEYAARLPENMAILNKNHDMLQAGWHLLLFQDFHRNVHKLAGEGGSYGFPELSKAAKPLDSFLLPIKERATPLSEAELAQIAGFMEKINAAVSVASSQETLLPVSSRPNYLYLASNDSRLAQYLILQWRQVEANWKALQWSWEQETFAQLYAQLHVLAENSAAFQFFELHDNTQHTDKCLRELHQLQEAPSGFQLANLNQQLQQLSLLIAPMSEAEYQKRPGSSRLRQGKVLKLVENDGHIKTYFLLQMQEMQNLWQTLQWNWHSETLQQLQEQVTVLDKNSINFGFSELSQCLQALTQALQAFSIRVPNPAELVQLNRLHDKTQSVAQNLLSQDSALAEPEDDGLKHIYVVEDDSYFAKYLSVQLEQAGYAVTLFSRLSGLAETVKRKPPAVLLVDIVLAEGDLAGPKAMFQIQKGRAEPLPVLFMSARTDIKARLAAVRAQGDAYFTKPLDMDALLAKLESLTLKNALPKTQQKVLILDNVKDSQAQNYAKILLDAKLDAKLLSDPLRFLDALEKWQPDVLLINAHLNAANATELATVVRQQKQYAQLAIIFYGMNFEQTWRLPVQRGVVDDVLGQDVPPGQLLATVLTRLHSVRASQNFTSA